MPREDQQKVLLFGIVFALAARTVFVFLGAALLSAFVWVFYLFGLILLVTAGNMLKPESTQERSADNIMIRPSPAPVPHHGLTMTGTSCSPSRTANGR